MPTYSQCLDLLAQADASYQHILADIQTVEGRLSEISSTIIGIENKWKYIPRALDDFENSARYDRDFQKILKTVLASALPVDDIFTSLRTLEEDTITAVLSIWDASANASRALDGIIASIEASYPVLTTDEKAKIIPMVTTLKVDRDNANAALAPIHDAAIRRRHQIRAFQSYLGQLRARLSLAIRLLKKGGIDPITLVPLCDDARYYYSEASPIWDSLKSDLIPTLIEPLESVELSMAAIMAGINKIIPTISAMLDDLGSRLSALFGSAIEGLGSWLTDAIGGFIQALIDALSQIAKWIWDALSGAISWLIDNILKPLANMISEALKFIVDFIVSSISTIIEQIVKFVQGSDWTKPDYALLIFGGISTLMIGISVALSGINAAHPFKFLIPEQVYAFVYKFLGFNELSSCFWNSIGYEIMDQPMRLWARGLFRTRRPDHRDADQMYYKGLIDRDEWYKLHTYEGWPDQYIVAHERDMYREPSLREITAIADTQSVSAEWVAQKLRFCGYDETDASMLAAVVARRAINSEITNLRTELIKEYVDGYLSDRELITALRALGYQDTDIGFIMDVAEVRKTRAIRVAQQKAIKEYRDKVVLSLTEAFRRDLIDDSEFLSELIAAGVDKDLAGQIVVLESIRKWPKPRRTTETIVV